MSVFEGCGMDETSPAQGWWKAIDGRWYPPASVPSTPPTRPPRHARAATGSPAGAPEKLRSGSVSPGYTAISAQYTWAQSKKPLRRPPRYSILAVLVVLTAGSTSAAAVVRARGGYDAHSKHTVTYSVTGSGSSGVSNITYLTRQRGNGLSGEVQVTDAPLPWTSSVVTSDLGLGTSFSIRVENGPIWLSYVICSISEDGKLLSSNEAEGPHAVASCSSVGS
jgi:hypothetical protein